LVILLKFAKAAAQRLAGSAAEGIRSETGPCRGEKNAKKTQRIPVVYCTICSPAELTKPTFSQEKGMGVRVETPPVRLRHKTPAPIMTHGRQDSTTSWLQLEEKDLDASISPQAKQVEPWKMPG
jgi:hypothetical protein